jgi:Zn2+/Cd2+-exporting ATPase
MAVAVAGVGVRVVDVLPEILEAHDHAGHDHGGHDHSAHDHNEPDRREPLPGGAERFDVEIDVTAALRRLPRESADVALKLVALNQAGEQLSASKLQFDEIELVVD